tara:strand:+ start:1695 stop:3755 length:2061 start_codon:yes stop_codon:yes gene_type:complete
MSVYKKFTAQDYAIVPFNAHKQYDFTSASAASNSINYFNTQWTSESIDLYTSGNIKYSQLDHLFYKNFKRDISNRLGKSNYTYQKRILYKQANTLSIPTGLYGHEIKPGTLYISSSNYEITDDSRGNLIISGTNINNYSTDFRANILNIGPVNGFKKYDLNTLDGYLTFNGYESSVFYKDGKSRVNQLSSYSTPNFGDEFDDSYYFNLIKYKNVNFSEKTLFNGDFPGIDFNGTNSEIKLAHNEKFNFNQGDDFTIDFWTNIKEPTVGQLVINVNNITASSDATENLTLVSSDGTTKTYRCTAGSNATDLGGGVTSIQWEIAQATPNKDDVKATNLANAINGATGHNGKLIATVNNDVVTIKQLDTPAEIGTIGNTTVTSTANFNSLVDGSVSSTFTGGTDVDYYLLSKSTTKTTVASPNEGTAGRYTTQTTGALQPKDTFAEPQFPFEVYAFNEWLYFSRSDGDTTTTYSSSYTPGIQQKITCRYQDSQMEIFINGVGSGTSGSDNIIKQSQNTANIYIGNKGGNSKFLSGSLSQINVYEEALSDTQILNHYSSSNGSPYIGNVFYQNGFVTITHPNYISALDTTGDGIINTLQFQGSHLIYENEYQCTVDEHEFNDTLNISARKIKSKDSDELADFTTGSLFKPYVTTIGLYNEDNELLVVGKLGQPIRTSNETDTTFIVRWDT